MPADIIYECSDSQDRQALALYLRTVADSLEAGQEIVLPDGDHAIPGVNEHQVTFGTVASRDTENAGEWRLSFDFEWPDDDGN